MEGMEYQTFQYYSYEDIKSLNEILKVDSIGFVNIYQDEKVIEYQIDRSKCLRLSDLIYLITENYAKIYLGQLLTIFLDLLKKVIKLEDKDKIEHLYLDDNRIWLNFKDRDQTIKVYVTKIDYSIAFTGYQCLLYEEGSNIPIPAKQKILKIIKDILNQFKNKKIFFNDSQKDKILKEIYNPIIQECDKLNILDTLNYIIGILQKQKYDSEEQYIDLDDCKGFLKLIESRKVTKQNTDLYIKDLIQNLEKEGSFFIENIFIAKIKYLFTILEKNNMILSTQIAYNKFEKDDEFIKQMREYYGKYQTILKSNAQIIIKQIFNDNLKKEMEKFKFEITDEEKQLIIDSSLNRILNMKLNGYFYNSPFYSIKTSQNHIQLCQQRVITKFSTDIVIEEVEMLISYKNHLMIDELI
ncbi:unnamed protein product [Paramecium sonneborni]|uniref:Uncharacterized protein n=1 Tax=Paramecium sonneborni TaxID=65129 RepID=A0A8S1RCX6_9CILI|nr:unnamed protein product [Paramecium sonneborni]